MPLDKLMSNARAVLAALGGTRGKAFFLDKAVILVGSKFFLVNFENVKGTYPRISRSVKTPSANLHVR
jgi:hypothetical protein